MKHKLAAAIVAGGTLLGGAATVLTSEGVADASQIVTVCKREVLNPFGGWDCVEWTTCLIESWGSWVCDDGTSGSRRPPGTIVPIRPIPR